MRDASSGWETSRDDLSAPAIAANLGTRFIAHRVLYYPSLPSTMLVAKEEARRGAAEGTVVFTGEQTAGRGRRERVWLSPEGGIALSVVLHPTLAELPSMIMVASVAVVHSIKLTTGLKPRIKWPNDILINDKKVCGILIENEVRGGRVEWSILGIGININIRMADYPDIQPLATSLSDELNRSVPRLEVARCLLVELEKLYLSLKSGAPVFEMWRETLATLGRKVQVSMGEHIMEGTAEAVDRDGSLFLRLEDGTQTRVVAGDVSLRY